jgi:hypothetical protein
MSTWRGSESRTAAAGASPRRRPSPSSAAADLRRSGEGQGSSTAPEIATLGAILAQEQCPVWRPSAPCILLGAAAWALVFVGLWALMAG